MTHEEHIKIDNYKAQYNSILGNIAIANRELEEIYERKDSLKITCSELDRQIATKSEALQKLYAIESTLKEERESKEQALKEREEGLEKDRIKFAYHIADENKRLAANIADYENVTLKLRQEIQDLVSKRDAAERDVEETSEQAAMLAIDVLSLEQEISTLTRKLEEASESHKSIVASASAEEKQIQERIKTLLKQEEEIIQGNQAKARVIELREEELSRRERDIEIVAKRWKRWHNSMFPDGELNI